MHHAERGHRERDQHQCGGECAAPLRAVEAGGDGRAGKAADAERAEQQAVAAGAGADADRDEHRVTVRIP